MRKLSFGLALLAVAVWILAPPAITQEDPWWRPLNPYGSSAGVTYGTQAPSLATTGQNPAPGELWVDTDGASDGGAMLLTYNATAAAWQSPGVQVGAGPIIFEGATVDAFETFLAAAEPTVGDDTYELSDNAAAADTYRLIFSLLDTNALDIANSVWLDASQIIFEGATGGNAFEIILDAGDATVGDSTYRLMDNAFADVYPVMFSNFATNSWDTANSVWGTINGLHYEGATANDFENALSSADPVVADAFFQMPNNDAEGAGPNTYAIIFSLLDTNAYDVLNSVWFETNAMFFEGTADDFEIILTAEDGTIGDATYSLSDRGLAADTYEIIATPDGERNTANLFYGEYTDAVAAAANADNVLLVKRAFVPQPVVVTHVDILNNDLANASAGDNTIAVAIYHDADAGVQIVELVGATDDGGGATTGLYTLDITDTTLQPGWYRFAFCAQDASDNDIELHQANADILLLWGAGAATGEMTATGANPCVAGDPPATTGALTQVADNMVFMLRTQ